MRGMDLYGPEKGSFRASFRFFRVRSYLVHINSFRACLHPEMGVHFRICLCPKMASGFDRDGFPQVVAGNKRCNSKPETAVQAASICLVTGTLLLVVPRYPPARASGITTSRWDRIVMVLTTRALPLSSQLGWRHSPSSTTTYLIEDEGSRRLG